MINPHDSQNLHKADNSTYVTYQQEILEGLLCKISYTIYGFTVFLNKFSWCYDNPISN